MPSRTLLLLRWILFTTMGWIAGIPLLMLLSGILEPVGLGKTAIALGMSLGISGFQWLILRKHFPESINWISLSPAAFTVPFLLVDVFGAGWFTSTEMGIVTCTLVGSILMAVVQYQFQLKSRGMPLLLWASVNLFAYALALVPPFTLTISRINQLHLPGALSVLLSFLTVLAGGPVIGWLTGVVLVRSQSPR